MIAQEENLVSSLVAEVNALSERQDSYERTSDLRLKRLENDVDLLEIAIDRFHDLLSIFEKLIHKIRTAYMESRIWEQVEEYRKNDGKKKHRSNRTTGFDVERKPGRSAERR